MGTLVINTASGIRSTDATRYSRGIRLDEWVAVSYRGEKQAKLAARISSPLLLQTENTGRIFDVTFN